jgi:hypothetical protein
LLRADTRTVCGPNLRAAVPADVPVSVFQLTRIRSDNRRVWLACRWRIQRIDPGLTTGLRWIGVRFAGGHFHVFYCANNTISQFRAYSRKAPARFGPACKTNMISPPRIASAGVPPSRAIRSGLRRNLHNARRRRQRTRSRPYRTPVRSAGNGPHGAAVRRIAVRASSAAWRSVFTSAESGRWSRQMLQIPVVFRLARPFVGRG